MKYWLWTLFICLAFSFRSQALKSDRVNFIGVTCPDAKILAHEIIRAELAGWRDALAGGICLDQAQFKYFLLGSGAGNDEGEDIKSPLLIEDPKQIKIKNVSRLNDGAYRVEFEIALTNQRVIRDEFVFDILPENCAAFKNEGCVSIRSGPSRIFILKKCFSKG